MAYQKEEKARIWHSHPTDEYNKMGVDRPGNGFRKLTVFLLVVVLAGCGYFLVNRAEEQVWPEWFGNFSSDRSSKADVEPYRYELEIHSDSIFYTLHPKNQNFIPYKKRNYDHSMYYSLQNSARGMNYAVRHGELAHLAFELQQVSDFGYCVAAFKEYKQLYKTAFMLDVLRMTVPDDMGKVKATPYEATYLLDIIRRDPKMRRDVLLMNADLMNALNSTCLDSIKNRFYCRLHERNIIAVWKYYLYMTEALGRQKNLLQALSESPSLQGADTQTYDKAKGCAMKVIDAIVIALSKASGRPAKHFSSFRRTAKKEINAAFVPGASPHEFEATSQALDACLIRLSINKQSHKKRR